MLLPPTLCSGIVAGIAGGRGSRRHRVSPSASMGLGSNAHADALVPGNEVAIHPVGASQEGSTGEQSRLWIHDDSHVGLLGSGHGVSSFGNFEIELTFQASA